MQVTCLTGMTRNNHLLKRCLEVQLTGDENHICCAMLDLAKLLVPEICHRCRPRTTCKEM